MPRAAPTEAGGQRRCVFVGDDGTFRVVEYAAGGDTDELAALQELVDGYIEHIAGAVAHPDTAVTLDVWVNELGGQRRDFRPNVHINALLAYPATLLVGPAVVTVTDRDCSTGSLPGRLIDAIRGALAEAGAHELPVAGVAEAAAHQKAARRQRQ